MLDSVKSSLVRSSHPLATKKTQVFKAGQQCRLSRNFCFLRANNWDLEYLVMLELMCKFVVGKTLPQISKTLSSLLPEVGPGQGKRHSKP